MLIAFRTTVDEIVVCHW